LWDGYYSQQFQTPTGVEMSLASNTVIVPMQVSPGQSFTAALVCLDARQQGSDLPSVSVGGGDIKFSSLSVTTVTYAAPGNSYPSQYLVLSVAGVVSDTAQPGFRNVSIANPGQQPGPAAPALIYVG
jgi:hypothetical protein